MGLTIRSKIKNCNIELDGGYGMLKNIREEVAILFDEDFGNLYKELPNYRWENWVNKANQILSNDKFSDEDSDLIEFLLMSDGEGYINYKTCKKVYDLLQKSKNKCCLRYAIYSKNDWEDLKELLLQCYKHRANLYWN